MAGKILELLWIADRNKNPTQIDSLLHNYITEKPEYEKQYGCRQQNKNFHRFPPLNPGSIKLGLKANQCKYKRCKRYGYGKYVIAEIFHVAPDFSLEVGTIELVDWTSTKARTGPGRSWAGNMDKNQYDIDIAN